MKDQEGHDGRITLRRVLRGKVVKNRHTHKHVQWQDFSYTNGKLGIRRYISSLEPHYGTAYIHLLLIHLTQS
jgi:hypothetical protein